MNISKLDHIGIRVMEVPRSIAFYEQFGFEVTRNDGDEHVVVLKHPSGVELNLLDSGDNDNDKKNVLMDMDARYPGYTHYAISVTSIDAAKAFMASKNIPITEGPVTFGDGKTSIFIRDPDRNVIEFTELP